MAGTSEEKSQQKRGDRWLLIAVVILFLIGIGIRSYAYLTASSQPRISQQQRSGNHAAKAVPDNSEKGQTRSTSSHEQKTSEEQGVLITLAPYLTEGGVSFFLGFCIGYVFRLVAKFLILVVGAIYCGLILLSHYGIITMDWGSFQDILQQVLFNTQTHIEGLRETIRISLPSITMGGIGIWRGMKKS